MADLNRLARELEREAKPLVSEIQSLREDRQKLVTLCRQLREQEIDKRAALSRLRKATATLDKSDQPTQLKLNLGPKIVGHSVTVLDRKSARRVARAIAKRHTPAERRGIRRLIGGIRDRLAVKQKGPVELLVKGSLGEKLSPSRRRDLQKILDMAGSERGQRVEQERGVETKKAVGQVPQRGWSV